MALDNNEEYVQFLFDTSETDSLSLMTSKSSDFENTTVVNVLKSPTHGLALQTSDDDDDSTLEATDQNMQDVLVEQPHATWDVPILTKDLADSASGVSDMSSFDSDVTPDFDYMFESPPPCGILGKSYRWIASRIKWYRKSGYVLAFEVICLCLTVACCFMGAYYWQFCPADIYVPRYIFINGALATISVCIKIMNTLWKIVARGREMLPRFLCAFVFGWVAAIMTLVEMIQFYAMSYSFKRRDENYCNETFYWLAHYKNIVFCIVMTMTAIIYIPGRSIYYLVEGRRSLPFVE